MPRTNKSTKPAPASKTPPKKKAKRDKNREKTIRGDNGFCIGAEWTPQGDE